MPSGGTNVMLIGAIPVGGSFGTAANNDFSVYASSNLDNTGGGMPSPGGPTQYVNAPYTQPLWLFNAEARLPIAQDVPQNLPRPTWKGNRKGPASTGAPITSALAGVAAPALGAVGAGDSDTAASNGEKVYCTTQAGAAYVAAMQVGYVALGATFAGIHGYRRNRGKAGWTAVWALSGALFPVVTGIVAVAQGYGK